MQETRRKILEILKTRYEATVDEVVETLRELRGDDITAVTVRHHLKVLQEEGLIDSARMRHRPTPGRPQYVYRLTDRGASFFPNNYQRLAANLLEQVEKHYTVNGVNVILEDVAQRMATAAQVPAGTLDKRLDAVVAYLGHNGYMAHWEVTEQGYILHMTNCPYSQLAHDTDALCRMDMRLISSMLGVVPRLLSRLANGDDSCSYLVPDIR
jgi:predicted ArsR family transcriptional regulator